MNLSPLKLHSLIIILVALSHLTVSLQETLNFDFTSFSLRNLTLLGDSYLRNGAVGLTREEGVPSSSSGSVICDSPVRFFDPRTKTSASFSTKISFVISNDNPETYGDGLAFFLSASNQTLGSPGAYMGLFNSCHADNNKLIAVEFDTRLDAEFGDPSANHIGLDVGSPRSIKTADVNFCHIDLKSGKLVTAWIDYYNSQKRLMVSLSYSSQKPEHPLLSVKTDLSKFFEEFMYVGFSASTEGSTEVHLITDWSFHTFELSASYEHPRSPAQPQNASDSSWNIGQVIPLFPAKPHNSYRSGHEKVALGMIIVAPVLLSAVFTTFGCYSFKKWKETRINDGIKSDMLKGPRKFTYKEINYATKGFHFSRILGHGAFGTVYKAFFPDSGLSFAVKRSKHTRQGESEFVAELSIIACLRHKNLLQLQGWCTEKGELLLVYDFMPNGSLDKMLHEDTGMVLTWAQRYNIALGVASVLSYLHQECEQQVIHRDVKTSNILLDKNFSPKLGDFGLARLLDHDKSPVSTLTAGTVGYLAPEYLQYGKATEKTDVFSFGVLILEITCGRVPISRDGPNQKMVNLVDWVWGHYSADKLTEAVDLKLKGDYEEEEVRRLLLLGLSCANPDSIARPSMRRALQVLNREADLPSVPKTKPSVTFSSDLPVSIRDIVSECENNEIAIPLPMIKLG